MRRAISAGASRIETVVQAVGPNAARGSSKAHRSARSTKPFISSFPRAATPRHPQTFRGIHVNVKSRCRHRTCPWRGRWRWIESAWRRHARGVCARRTRGRSDPAFCAADSRRGRRRGPRQASGTARVERLHRPRRVRRRCLARLQPDREFVPFVAAGNKEGGIRQAGLAATRARRLDAAGAARMGRNAQGPCVVSNIARNSLILWDTRRCQGRRGQRCGAVRLLAISDTTRHRVARRTRAAFTKGGTVEFCLLRSERVIESGNAYSTLCNALCSCQRRLCSRVCQIR